MNAFDAVAALFGSATGTAYYGEAVTLAQHMLQAGALAKATGAPDSLVAAALLHDVGHALESTPEYGPHEVVGANWLGQWFPTDTCEPVLLHVEAKRCLCATERSYFDCLSEASRQSLIVQGGPMSLGEVRAFESRPFAPAAIAVRRWDEAAKDPTLETLSLAHFQALLERVAKGSR